jgi:tRNA(fMet)-specific endonuclease VapC
LGRRLILDTNILVALERRTIGRTALFDDELAMAALGRRVPGWIELAGTGECAAEHSRFLASFTSEMAETKRTILSQDAKARLGDLPGVVATDA